MLIQSIHNLEETREFQAHRIDSVSPVNEYLRFMRVPYGFLLQKPKEELVGRLKKSKTFLDDHMTKFQHAGMGCMSVAVNIRETLTMLLSFVEQQHDMHEQ